MTDVPRRATFFRITVALCAVLLVVGVGVAVTLALNSGRISDGGFGWILTIGAFLVAEVLICFAAAVTSALSLWRGEAHRGLSMLVLIGSGLVVLTAGTFLVRTNQIQRRHLEEVARLAKDPPRQALREGETEIPDSLIEHFRREGFSMRPAIDWRSTRDWTLDLADLGPRCEVVLRIRGFPLASPVELINQRLMEYNAASVLNEQARLAMFYPVAHSITGDKADCEAWTVKSKVITERLLEAFRSYRP